VKKLIVLLLVSGICNTASAEWKSYLNVDEGSTREGFAFSNWTIISTKRDAPDENINAALVAACNDKGQTSLYLRMLSIYPAVSNAEVLSGQIRWDSSTAYDVPFTYDASLNALRLRSGLEDSFSMIRDGNKVTIKVPWKDSQFAVFEIPLSGSSEALKAAFDFCLFQ